jgi:hypothetical protein
LYYGGKIFFEILGDARDSDQIQKSQSAVILKLGLGLKVQHIARGWLARRQLRRLRLRQASDQIRKSQSAVVLKLGLGLKVQCIARGWLARRQLRRLRLQQATAPDLNTAPDTTGNARGSGENVNFYLN